MTKIDKIKTAIKNNPATTITTVAAVSLLMFVGIAHRNYLHESNERAIENHEHQLMIMTAVVRRLTDDPDITARLPR